MLRRLRMWLRRRSDFERDLSDELAFHLERRTDDLVGRGLTRDAARAQARREFGNPAAWAEHCRDARGLRLLEELRQDVRFAWRGIVRRRLTAAIAVFTLTFGIGISGGVFTMLSAATLRPQVADDPDSFVRVYTALTSDLARPRPFAQTTLEQYLALRERLTTVLTAGALVALLSAAGFARVLAKLQFTIAPFDPRLYAIAAVPLILVIAAALIVPARRATSVDQLRALKYE